MPVILILAGIVFIIYGFAGNAVPFIIGGIVLVLIGMLVVNRGRSRYRKDEGGNADTIGYNNHHDDSTGGDGGGD